MRAESRQPIHLTTLSKGCNDKLIKSPTLIKVSFIFERYFAEKFRARFVGEIWRNLVWGEFVILQILWAHLLAKHLVISTVVNHRSMFALQNIQSSLLNQIPTSMKITDPILPHESWNSQF